ncbi:hypothetical protein PoMZ_12926 [Pyricularia oryzae]|uniref:Uncharacterized protein n=1 Tax=Pyricularia oryzae TaxID=318829 RepID=A0A4P7NU74_PYROR|nr:hypothetical protein PoMZ_12926 [Pyricularia oryzae]
MGSSPGSTGMGSDTFRIDAAAAAADANRPTLGRRERPRKTLVMSLVRVHQQAISPMMARPGGLTRRVCKYAFGRQDAEKSTGVGGNGQVRRAGDGLVAGEQVRPTLQKVLQPAASPALAGEALKDVDLCASDAACGVKDTDAGVLAVAQQGTRVIGVQRRQAVEFCSQLDEVCAELGDVPTPRGLVHLDPFLLQPPDFAPLGRGGGRVTRLLVLDAVAPLVELMEQRHLEGPVYGLAQDLVVVRYQVLQAGCGEELVGCARRRELVGSAGYE